MLAIYFNGGKPFTLLNDIEKGKIKTYHKIRNAIAHKSKKASKEFQKLLTDLLYFLLRAPPKDTSETFRMLQRGSHSSK